VHLTHASMKMHLGFVLLSLTALSGCISEPAVELGPDSSPGSLGKGDSWGDEFPGGWEAIAARCAPPVEDEPILYANEFHWWYTHEEMMTRFDEVYSSGMRLFDRAYYDAEADEFAMPITETWGGRVVLSQRLIQSVGLHIQKALDRQYADAIFFPDMGHSHFFIPEEHWDANYAGTPVAELAGRYTRLFEDPELLVLYHTAEQLEMYDEEGALFPDRDLQWRYFTRNPVGDNRGLGRIDLLRDATNKGNTARDLEGHHYLGAGFNVSASTDGCFPYVHNGEVYYFDLSLADLPYTPGGGEEPY
jgi:hypothetical protein